MVHPKLPPDAFALYVALGLDRSFGAIAAHYKCSKQAVARASRREGWMPRLAEIKAAARKETDAKLAESVAEADERHRKMLRGMSARAMKGIAEHPIDNGMDSIRAAATVIKLERLLLNQPTSHSSVEVQATTKAEMERFLVSPETPEDDDDDGEEDNEW